MFGKQGPEGEIARLVEQGLCCEGTGVASLVLCVLFECGAFVVCQLRASESVVFEP